jgi:hypothetical protein
MDAGHYPVMVCSSANIANHDVPGCYLAAPVDTETKFKHISAEEAFGHILSFGHSVTFSQSFCGIAVDLRFLWRIKAAA